MRTTKILLFITLSLSAFSQCALVYNPFTNQFNCGGASGTVGGASNLTTVGAIPYVSAAGILNQDPTALFWDAANNRLGIGTNAPVYLLDVLNATGATIYARSGSRSIGISSYGSDQNYIEGFGQSLNVGTYSTHDLVFRTNNSVRARLAATTGNLLIGTTTDGNFRLDVASSGSSGTLRAWDQTPTTGSTSFVVRAGAGQGTNLLQQWQDSSGSSRLQVTSTFGMHALGTFFAVQDSAGTINQAILQSTLDVNNTYSVRWSSTGDASGTKDLSLTRASAGVLQVGDGGSNANGTVAALKVGIGATPVSSDLYVSKSVSGDVGPIILLNNPADAAGDASFIGGYNSASASPWRGGIRFNQGVGSRVDILSGAASSISGMVRAISFFGNGNARVGGSVTDENFRLDVAASGSAGTMRVYDQTATTGTTRLDIRAGAGQSGVTLRVQDSAGTAGFSVGADTVTVSGVHGVLSGQSQFGLTGAGYGFSGLQLYNSGQLGWSSTSDYSATKDIGLARNAAGLLEVNSGTAGTYRDLTFRIAQWRNGTEATCDSTTRGQVVMVQGGTGVADTFRVCRKDNADAYAWTALY